MFSRGIEVEKWFNMNFVLHLALRWRDDYNTSLPFKSKF